MADRARQAVYLQALRPIGETPADPNSYGVRPTRRCAEALDQGFKAWRQKTSATWILEGDSQGFFDHLAVPWLEEHLPLTKPILAKGLRWGFSARGPLSPPTAGVPPGGSSSPVIRNLVLDGLEAVVQGSPRHRRAHTITSIGWADDFLITATSPEVLTDVVLPPINAF